MLQRSAFWWAIYKNAINIDIFSNRKFYVNFESIEFLWLHYNVMCTSISKNARTISEFIKYWCRSSDLTVSRLLWSFKITNLSDLNDEHILIALKWFFEEKNISQIMDFEWTKQEASAFWWIVSIRCNLTQRVNKNPPTQI